MGFEDQLIWKITTNKKFTIKSAYYLEMSKAQIEIGESSSRLGTKVVWKSNWGLDVSNAINIFI